LIDIVSPAEAAGVEPVNVLQPVVADMVTCDPGAREDDRVQDIVELEGFVMSWKYICSTPPLLSDVEPTSCTVMK